VSFKPVLGALPRHSRGRSLTRGPRDRTPSARPPPAASSPGQRISRPLLNASGDRRDLEGATLDKGQGVAILQNRCDLNRAFSRGAGDTERANPSGSRPGLLSRISHCVHDRIELEFFLSNSKLPAGGHARGPSSRKQQSTSFYCTKRLPGNPPPSAADFTLWANRGKRNPGPWHLARKPGARAPLVSPAAASRNCRCLATRVRRRRRFELAGWPGTCSSLRKPPSTAAERRRSLHRWDRPFSAAGEARLRFAADCGRDSWNRLERLQPMGLGRNATSVGTELPGGKSPAIRRPGSIAGTTWAKEGS